MEFVYKSGYHWMFVQTIKSYFLQIYRQLGNCFVQLEWLLGVDSIEFKQWPCNRFFFLFRNTLYGVGKSQRTMSSIKGEGEMLPHMHISKVVENVKINKIFLINQKMCNVSAGGRGYLNVSSCKEKNFKYIQIGWTMGHM